MQTVILLLCLNVLFAISSYPLSRRFIFELLDVAALGDEALDKFEFESIQTSVSAFMGKDNHKGLSSTPDNINTSNKKKNSGDKKEKKIIASNKGGGGGGFGASKK